MFQIRQAWSFDGQLLYRLPICMEKAPGIQGCVCDMAPMLTEPRSCNVRTHCTLCTGCQNADRYRGRDGLGCAETGLNLPEMKSPWQEIDWGRILFDLPKPAPTSASHSVGAVAEVLPPGHVDVARTFRSIVVCTPYNYVSKQAVTSLL